MGGTTGASQYHQFMPCTIRYDMSAVTNTHDEPSNGIVDRFKCNHKPPTPRGFRPRPGLGIAKGVSNHERTYDCERIHNYDKDL